MTFLPIAYWFYGMMSGALWQRFSLPFWKLAHTAPELVAVTATIIALLCFRKNKAIWGLGFIWGLLHNVPDYGGRDPRLAIVKKAERNTLFVESEAQLFRAWGDAQVGDLGTLSFPRHGELTFAPPQGHFDGHPTPQKNSLWQTVGRDFTRDWPEDGKNLAQRLAFGASGDLGQNTHACRDLGIENHLGQSTLAVVAVSTSITLAVSGPLLLLYSTLCMSPRLFIYLSWVARMGEVSLLWTWASLVPLASGAFRGLFLVTIRKLAPQTWGSIGIGPTLLLGAFMQSIILPLTFLTPGVLVGWAITAFAGAELERRHLLSPLRIELYIYVVMYALFDEGRASSAVADILLYPLLLALTTWTHLSLLWGGFLARPLGEAWQDVSLITTRSAELVAQLNQNVFDMTPPSLLRVGALALTLFGFLKASQTLALATLRLSK